MYGYIRGGGSGNSLKINTGNGYVDIGPMNTGWTHIYTDRPRFIFNKDIYSITGGFSAYSTRNLYLKTHGTTRMTILKSNGYVGIGTTNPKRNLHIYDNVRPSINLENPLGRLEFVVAKNNGDGAPNSRAGDAIVLLGNKVPNQSYHGLIFNMNDDNNDGKSYIKFVDWANYEIMGIYNNAKVRINGTLISKKIEVKTNVWGDFVFDKDYSLISLEDLEKYINEHKHLPGVPSSEEVIKNGINVAEINVILMQKIEELTLYMIEQNKKIKELEKTVENLKQ